MGFRDEKPVPLGTLASPEFEKAAKDSQEGRSVQGIPEQAKRDYSPTKLNRHASKGRNPSVEELRANNNEALSTQKTGRVFTAHLEEHSLCVKSRSRMIHDRCPKTQTPTFTPPFLHLQTPSSHPVQGSHRRYGTSLSHAATNRGGVFVTSCNDLTSGNESL